MTTETETQNQDQQTEQNEGSENWRNEPGAKALMQNAKAAAERAAAVESELNALKQQLENDKKAIQQQELEAKGEYQKALDLLKSELETTKAAHAADVRKSALTNALRDAGMSKNLAIAGAIATCPEDADVSEYVAELKKQHPDDFTKSQTTFTPGDTPPQGAPSGDSKTNWQQIKADMNSRDPRRVDPAIVAYSAYVAEHNQKPPGW